MKKSYSGSCHCGAIRFECDLDLAAGTRRCNCSFCAKSRFWKAFAMQGEFRLLAGESELSDYQASTSEWPQGDVHHYFCGRCGIRAFSRGYLDIAPFDGGFHAVNVACLDDATDAELAAAPIQYEDGRAGRWERAPAVTATCKTAVVARWARGRCGPGRRLVHARDRTGDNRGMTSTYTLHRGTAPLLVSLPHDGHEIPTEIAARMVPSACRAPDTDWHVSRLYAFARELGASILVPRYSRYVVDLNRPPDDTSLYPGQNTTGLCPAVQFSGEAVYREGQAPSPDEVAARVERFWRPYHEALQAELDRMRSAHGRAVLWEGHSIRGSELPFLFEGRLPDLNLGTAAGASCSEALQARLERVLAAQSDYDWVANGRFKGGYITRHYGRPEQGVDAVQLEISQRIYMDEATFGYDEVKAMQAQRVLRRLLETTLAA